MVSLVTGAASTAEPVGPVREAQAWPSRTSSAPKPRRYRTLLQLAVPVGSIWAVTNRENVATTTSNRRATQAAPPPTGRAPAGTTGRTAPDHHAGAPAGPRNSSARTPAATAPPASETMTLTDPLEPLSDH